VTPLGAPHLEESGIPPRAARLAAAAEALDLASAAAARICERTFSIAGFVKLFVTRYVTRFVKICAVEIDSF
jgi:hypothetical protein